MTLCFAEREGTMPHGLCFSASFGTNMTTKVSRKNLFAPVASLDTEVANNVPFFALGGNLPYCNWQLFVLNQVDKDGCNTVQTQCCVLHQLVLSAFLGKIPHFLARTILSSPDIHINLCVAYKDEILTKLSNTVA